MGVIDWAVHCRDHIIILQISTGLYMSRECEEAWLHARMRGSRCFWPQPRLAMWLRWGPGVVALVAHGQSAQIVPIARLLHVELAHDLQSLGIPSRTQVWKPQSAMGCWERPPVRVGKVPQAPILPESPATDLRMRPL